MLYKVVLTIESVDEIVKYQQSNESCRAVLFFAKFIKLYKVVLTFATVNQHMLRLSKKN